MISIKNYKKTQDILPSKFSYEQFKNLCALLYEINREAHVHETEYWSSVYAERTGESEEAKNVRLENLKKEISQISTHGAVTLVVEGQSGEFFTIVPDSNLDEVFNPRSLPVKIKRITFENHSNYKVMVNKYFNNRFNVVLNFTDNKINDFKAETDDPHSYIEVQGVNETWVLGIIERIKKLIGSQTSAVSYIIHKVLRYQYVVWFIGIPTVFFGLVKLSKVNDSLSAYPVSLGVVAYFCIFLLFLSFFRIFYNYFKWLFPYMELSEQPKRLQTFQRGIAIFIALGIISGWLSLLAEHLLK